MHWGTADRATSIFQRRQQQAARAREAIAERRQEFAGTLDLDAGMIEPVQLDDRGEEIGFVPDAGGRETLAERFADDRPFVEPAQALVDADPRDGVLTRTDPEATNEIAAAARADTAADAEFITPEDLDAEVGPGGVEDITTRPDRRDDIAERVRGDLAAEDRFANPGDFGVDVGPQGVEDAPR